jgi:chromate reductase
MAKKIKILGIYGSLRKGAFSKLAMYAAKDLVPDGAEMSVFEDLGKIPPFNQDDEQNPPEPVRQLKEKIKEADAILISTPEYNYSVPGVLKNAIDWASRPYGDNSWEGKPVAIMSTSPGMFGGVRAQYHLRQSFVFLNMRAVNRPEVMITNAHEKFDEEGKLTDDTTKEKIIGLFGSLISLAVEK